MSPKPRTCLFCGTQLTGIRAREHVLPKWVLRHVGAEHYKALNYSEGEAFEHRSPPTMGFVEGRVCQPCNGGWMSALEVAAKPTLERLIDGQVSVTALSSDQRIVIARWATKTSLMLQTAGLRDYEPGAKVFRDVAAGRMPSQVLVLGLDATGARPMRYGVDVGWLYNPEWTLLPPFTDEEGRNFRGTHRVTLKVTIWLRNLILTTGRWPNCEWRPVLWRAWHEPLYIGTTHHETKSWDPPPVPADADSLMRLSHKRLALRAPSALIPRSL